MSKLVDLQTAISLIPDGASILIGGFMGVGSPHRLIDGLVQAGRVGLTVIANDTARPGIGIGRLIDARAIRRLVVSHIGTNPETQRQMIAGELDVVLTPQGTLVEQIRAAGHGLGGVLTRTGLGTIVEDGKMRIEIDGETWLLEKPIRADFALLAAERADPLGNLVYATTARNFNPAMAMAASTVIAEVREIVEVGAIPPDSIMTPGVLIDHLLEDQA
jgi:acetate CoA/acetoacetate CoA-transferase alpha subunit